MKATAPTLSTETSSQERGAFSVACELFKARLTALVLVTTVIGFYLGERGAVDFWLMFHALSGTALLAAGAAALNQLLERDHDAKMERTGDRPLPAGHLSPGTVLVVGGVISAAGLIYLAIAVNLITSVLGSITLVSYLFVYTPLKRVTSLNTAIGAIPGALPPLMGWTAARGEVTIEGWSLFAILFFWQLPHFMAIAWIYREDYGKAGYVMLPVVDPSGERTGRQAVSHTVGLLPISLCPFLFRMVGGYYAMGALFLGIWFFWRAVQFSRKLDEASARRLFYASIIYLPLLLGLMIFDKIRT
jgi:protoheme IX farnesyltransferase